MPLEKLPMLLRTVFFAFILSLPTALAKNERPNILWLDAEDANVGWFGAYGNPAATTPHIDRLAAEGFLYTHAFANAPVCAPSRSGWITGVLALSMGTHPMRSRNDIPHDLIPYYPDYLRAAGYYSTNPGKTDYNIGGRPDREAWDPGRDWQGRKNGQPFFHVAHFPQSHESRAFGSVDATRHDPGRQRVRAYHPDIPRIRKNYAHYADQIEQMDAEVGKLLARLEAEGLAEDTIVIFTTDHGGVMPASKRFLTDSGLHAPLILRIPEKFKHLWPAAEPGRQVDRLVSFVDLPKTWLSLAQAEVPSHMQGRIFLGPNQEPAHDTHFAFRGRMDERMDQVRAVRDKRFLYIKNYMPYLPAGQRLAYLWRMEATQAWESHHRAGQTDEITGRFFRPRPQVEELYDTLHDPDNVINLADQPEHRKVLATMRAALREWQLSVYDAGMVSEEEMVRRAGEHGTTIYQMVRDPALYDLPAYVDAADLALAKESRNAARLVDYLDHEDAGLRYWGVVGLKMLDPLPQVAIHPLRSALQDPAHDVRAMAAWALIQAKTAADEARDSLRALLEEGSYATVLALAIIDIEEEDISSYRAAIESAISCSFNHDYGDRMKAYLLGKIK